MSVPSDNLIWTPFAALLTELQAGPGTSQSDTLILQPTSGYRVVLRNLRLTISCRENAGLAGYGDLYASVYTWPVAVGPVQTFGQLPLSGNYDRVERQGTYVWVSLAANEAKTPVKQYPLMPHAWFGKVNEPFWIRTAAVIQAGAPAATLFAGFTLCGEYTLVDGKFPIPTR